MRWLVCCSLLSMITSAAPASRAHAQTTDAQTTEAPAAETPAPEEPASEEAIFVPTPPPSTPQLAATLAPPAPPPEPSVPTATVEIDSEDSPRPTVLVLQDQRLPMLCMTPCRAVLAPGEAVVQVMRGALTGYGQHPTTETFTRLVLVPPGDSMMTVQMANHLLVVGILLDVGGGLIAGAGLIALSTLHGDAGLDISLACDGLAIVLGIVGAVLIYGLDRPSDVRMRRAPSATTALRLGPGGLALTF